MSATSSSPADPRPSASSAPGDITASAPPSLEDDARQLLASAAAGVPLRLLGGMGIQVLLGQRLHPAFRRQVADLDFLTTRRAGAAVERLIAAHGWEPRRRFNAVHGARRLLFDEPAGGPHHIDVFVGGFRMCHELPLLERLEERPETLPATDLLLTKLQIVTLNDKDRRDLYALLLGCLLGTSRADGSRAASSDEDRAASGEADGAASGEEDGAASGDEDGAASGEADRAASGDEDGAASGEADRAASGEEGAPPTIEAPRIADLAAADWGLCHTIELNLGRLRDGLGTIELDADSRERIAGRLDVLAEAIQAAPKSRGWRLRARVGERRRWYEDPEEVAR